MKYESDLIDKMINDIEIQISDLQYEYTEGKIHKESYDFKINELYLKKDKISQRRKND